CVDNTAVIARFREVHAELTPLLATVEQLAELQLALDVEFAKSIFDGVWYHALPSSVRAIVSCDRLVVNGPEDIEMWTDGTGGDHDSVAGYFDLHPYIIEGKIAEYAHLVKGRLRAEHHNMIERDRAEVGARRARLLRELDALNNKPMG